MRRNLMVAILAGAGLTCMLWRVTAAQVNNNRGVAPIGGEARVALVDVAYIFKNYEKFSRLYTALKEEVRAREKEIADAQNELKVLMNQRQQLTPDSPDYKRLETKIVQKKGELELAAENARREFTQKEANLYHQTYQEVEATIAAYAERYGITLVLRASRETEASTNNPQDVVKEVSQMVIYSQPGMDITQTILTALNGQDKAAGTPKANPTVTPGKQGATQIPRTSDAKNDVKTELRRPAGTKK